MIKLVVFDIDGVITDGTVLVDSMGNEQKKINMKDVDGIYALHRAGFRIAAVTGEDTPIVDYFETRFPWDSFFRGNKTKDLAVQSLADKYGLSLEEIAYIGDGRYDVAPIKMVGLGVCPADAISAVKEVAKITLSRSGGSGCCWELAELLQEKNTQEGQK